MQKYFLVLLIGGALTLGGCAEAPEQISSLVHTELATPISDGQPASPPAGFVSFCIHNQAVCAGKQNPTGTVVALNDKARADLVAINTLVNNSIKYESDEDQYGVANKWNINAIGHSGDCKDYALAKQQALIAAGLPASALRIAIVKTPRDELHAVLTVDTDKGDLVLDSLRAEILPWSDTRYSWITRQSQDNPLQWVSIASAY